MPLTTVAWRQQLLPSVPLSDMDRDTNTVTDTWTEPGKRKDSNFLNFQHFTPDLRP